MRSRTELVEALIAFREPLESLWAELRQYGWDCEEELAVLNPEDVIAVLSRFISGDISANDVEAWANLLECREDIGFAAGHEEPLGEAVYWLANPVINYPITAS